MDQRAEAASVECIPIGQRGGLGHIEEGDLLQADTLRQLRYRYQLLPDVKLRERLLRLLN